MRSGSECTISKWGNSLAVRIPLAIAKQAGLGEGDCVKMTLERDGAIVLRPAGRKYDLSELVARITIKNRHREATKHGLLLLTQDLYAVHKDNQMLLHARFGLGEDGLKPFPGFSPGGDDWPGGR